MPISNPPPDNKGVRNSYEITDKQRDKAMRLEVIQLKEDVYRVAGSTDTYIVFVSKCDDGEPECYQCWHESYVGADLIPVGGENGMCESFKYRGNCSHMVAVSIRRTGLGQ